MMKKALFFAGTVCLFLVFCLCGCSEDPPQTEDPSAYSSLQEDATYAVSQQNNDGGIAITGVKAALTGKVTVPSEINGQTVTGIADGAFRDCSEITQLVLPDSVTVIGKGAFSGCRALEKVTVKGELTSISADAFSGTAYLAGEENHRNGAVYAGNYLLSLDEPEKLKGKYVIEPGTVGCADGLFKGCIRLESIELPDSLRFISAGMFSGCEKVTAIRIPQAVSYIASDAFEGCASLKAITVDEKNETYTDENGVLMAERGEKIVRCPQKLGSGTFDGREGIKKVGDHAFSGCKGYERITFVNKLLYLGAYAFDGCSSLKSFSISSALDDIYEYTFRNCSQLEYLNLTPYIRLVGEGCFYGCRSLTEFSFAESTLISDISPFTFYGCTALKKVELHGELRSIGERAFYGCKALKSIDLSGVEEVMPYAFSHCDALQKIKTDETLTDIGANAFEKCSSLTSFAASSGLERLGTQTFYACTALAKADLSKSGLVSTGDAAFSGCKKLAEVRLNEGLFIVSDNCFTGCTSLKSIDLPQSTTEIGQKAFAQSGIMKITLPKGVSTVKTGAFEKCVSLRSVTVVSERCSVYFDKSTIPSTATVYAKKNSDAAQYASEYGLKLVER